MKIQNTNSLGTCHKQHTRHVQVAPRRLKLGHKFWPWILIDKKRVCGITSLSAAQGMLQLNAVDLLEMAGAEWPQKKRQSDTEKSVCESFG